MIVASYSYSRFSPESIDNNIEVFKKLAQKIPFDTIAFTGYSGAMVAPILAHATNKKPLLVRREHSKHSYFSVEGDFDFNKVLIVDDFIESGETIVDMIREINSKEKSPCRTPGIPIEIIGAYLYDIPCDRAPKYGKQVSLLSGLKIFTRTWDNDFEESII